jgi:anti-sigma regulatory factor (Ser/Thr protein kinase)
MEPRVQFGEAPASRRPSLALRVLPEPESGAEVRSRVAAFAASHGMQAVELDGFLSAVGEAVANAVEHSGVRDAIEIDCVAGEDRVLATVRDRGVGFDVSAALPVAPEPPRAEVERGRGLHIMRYCSEILSIRSAPGKGTSVVVGSFLRGAVGSGARRASAGRDAAA